MHDFIQITTVLFCHPMFLILYPLSFAIKIKIIPNILYKIFNYFGSQEDLTFVPENFCYLLERIVSLSEATKWLSDRTGNGKCINVTNRIRVFYKILLSTLTGKKSGRRWNSRDLQSHSVERQQYLCLSVNQNISLEVAYNWTKRRKVSTFKSRSKSKSKDSFSANSILTLLIMQTR